ncbi:MAG: Lrp/AsnC family transcriptional regulator, partial [Deltaproteobacteria bacterium]|nr:Lrp/AsnC family transcriptional regulator [Deltaproteobacteria bacterium]
VPKEKVEAFVDAVNAYSGVTHNYRRSHDYNIWFTFIAPSEEDLERSLDEIKKKTGIDDILNMPVTRKFKIDASFDL